MKHKILYLLLSVFLGLITSQASEATFVPSLARNDGHLCAAHISQHERLKQIPTHLLAAISKVESGRYNPKTQQVVAWPWTINVNGEGRYFSTKAEAVRYVKGLLAKGIESIDVGCMQVNLRHHPQAFESIEDAFEPRTNIEYAAQFLTNLKNSLGSWNKAVAYYHSANAQHHIPYRKKVYETWLKERRNPTTLAIVTPEIPYGAYRVSYGPNGKVYRPAALKGLPYPKPNTPQGRIYEARYQLAQYRDRTARVLAQHEKMQRGAAVAKRAQGLVHPVLKHNNMKKRP